MSDPAKDNTVLIDTGKPKAGKIDAGKNYPDKALVRSVILTQFAPPFMFSGVAVALPSMAEELQAGAVSLGLVETLFLGSQLAFLLPIGKLADASDKRSMYTFGLLGFGLCSLLIGAISSIGVILFLRFLQGIFSAVFAVTGTALIVEIVPAEQRGRAFGSSIGAMYAGLTLGPIIAGFLIDWSGWRGVFGLGGILLVFAFCYTRLHLPTKWKSPPRDFVNLPSVLLGSCAVYSLIAGSALLHLQWWGASCLAVSALLATAFIFLQLRITRPLVDFTWIRSNRLLKNALIVQLLLYCNAFASTFMLSLFLQVSLVQSARMSGQILAAGTVIMAIAAPMAGRLSDRYRSKQLIVIGIVFIMLSAVGGTRLTMTTSNYWVLAIVVLQGIGFGFFSSPNMKSIMNSVRVENSSVASSLSATSRSLGIVGGTLISTILIAGQIGENAVTSRPEELALAIRQSYQVLSTIVLAALVLSIVFTRVEGEVSAVSPR